MKYYLGIDVGGTNTKWAIVEGSSFHVKKFSTAPTPKTKLQFLKLLERVITESKTSHSLSGIGIGLPGIVDVKRGVLVHAPHLPFLNGWHASQFFKKFKIPTRFDNDSRCFVLAEATLGAGKGLKNIVGLTIGTGVGGGIFLNGDIYHGAHFGAGEFGHMVTDRKMSLDKLGGRHTPLPHTEQTEALGLGVANIINLLDPEMVVLGGGGITKNIIPIADVQKIARAHIMSPLGKKIPIVRTKLEAQAQAIGAALLFLKK